MLTGGKGAESKGSGRRTAVEKRSITRSFEAREYLRDLDFDESLLPSAKNIITRSLGLTTGNTVVVVVEVGRDEIGAAILAAAEEAGTIPTAFLVGPDQAANDAFIRRLIDRMTEADASVFVGSYDGLPTPFRRKLTATAKGRRRHAHLAGITAAILRRSLRGDFTEAHAFGEALNDAIGVAQRLDVRSATGTDLRIKLGPIGWHHASSLIPSGKWSNLPGGELLTSPVSVDGVIVPDGGAFLPDGSEHPRSSRIELHFQDSYLTRARGLDAGDPLMALLGDFDDCKRVGRIGLGTNIGLLVSVGALLQDRTAPGFHLTLGHPAGELTGATWSCPIEIPMFVRRADVLADGTPFLVRGRYARNLRNAPIA
ncbi:MAG: hypothetical protein DRJ42_13510 [Deltaproteobacteria bacterium]|nr:MAG: hypothetical protein DRJ42_13510 [Deltaproteobacteria bacterium]